MVCMSWNNLDLSVVIANLILDSIDKANADSV